MAASTETLSYKVQVVGAQQAVSDLGAVDASLHKFQQSGVASAAAARQMAAGSDHASTHLAKLTDNLFAAATVRPVNSKAVAELAQYANLSEASVRRMAEGMQRVERNKAFRQLADDAGMSHLQVARLRAGMGDLRGAAGSAASALGPVGIVLAIITASTLGVAKAVLDAQMALQRLSQSYGAVFGGGAAAQLDVVYQQTKAVGLEFMATAEAAKSFFAAGQGTTLAPELNTIFKAVTNAGAALQLSTEQVNGTFIALGQMISKGKVQAEELRGQLGERLPGAFQAAAKAMGMTTAELDKFMADGKLTAEDLLPKLAQVLEEKYAKAAENAANTAQGAINRMSTEWTFFKANIMDSGPMISVINAVTNALESSNRASKASAERARLDKALAADGVAPKSRDVFWDGVGNSTVIESYTEDQREIIRIKERQDAYSAQREQQEAANAEKALAERSATITKILKNTEYQKRRDLIAQHEEVTAALEGRRTDYKKDGAFRDIEAQQKALADLDAQQQAIDKKYKSDMEALDKKGSGAAKSAAVAQADYAGEIERTRSAIDSLQAQLDLDKGETLARAKIRIEQEYQSTLSKTREEMDKQVARGSLTRAQADALQAEKATAAELQKRLSLRDAETKAQEKSVRLAEGQLSFYKEYSQLSGQYSNQLELQVRLIDAQAKKYEDLEIPADLIEDWKRLRLLQESYDPVDGAYRGLKKFSAEYGNEAKQWESLAYSWASGFESATKSAFDSFIDNGRVSFESLSLSFKSLLKTMAYQALVQPIVLTVVNGMASALYSSTSAASVSAGGAAGSNGLVNAGLGMAQQYGLNQLMGQAGSGVMGGMAGGLNTWAAGVAPAYFAPNAASAAASSAVGQAYASMGATGASFGPTQTLTGAMGVGAKAAGIAGLGAGVGMMASPYLNQALGLGTGQNASTGAMVGGLGATAVLGTLAAANIWNPGGWALAGIAGLSALLGGGVGGAFGEWNDAPGLYAGATIDLSKSRTGQQMEDQFRDRKHPWSWYQHADDTGYLIQSRNRDGMSVEAAQQATSYLEQIAQAGLALSDQIATSIGSIGSSFADQYKQQLASDALIYIGQDWEGETPDIEGLGKELVTEMQRKIGLALRSMDISSLATAADGALANTTEEMMSAITKSINFFNVGESLGNFSGEFSQAVSGKVLDMLNSMDTTTMGLDIDKTSLAGWNIAAQAVQAWETVDTALQGILNPVSELDAALGTATTQFDGWIASLRNLGWQEQRIAEVEKERAVYLEQYRTALTRASEQDLSLRVTALSSGSDSNAYALAALRYKQENELAELAQKFGKNSDIYQTAVATQQAETTKLRIDQLQSELASALQDEISSAESLKTAFDGVLDALAATRRDLWSSKDANPLGTSFQASQQAFDAAFAKGMAGDAGALQDLPALAQTLLDQGRARLGTSAEYTDLFYGVDGKLKRAQDYAASLVGGQDAQPKELRAQTASSQAVNRSVDAIRGDLATLNSSLLEALKGLNGSGGLTGGGSLSQREALLQSKADQLNAQKHQGRSDWTAQNTLEAIYAEGMTLEQWYDRYGKKENLGVTYDSLAARNAIMANKVAQLNAQKYQGRSDWTEAQVAKAITDAGMSGVDEWYQRYGKAEGVANVSTSPSASRTIDDIIKAKVAAMNAGNTLSAGQPAGGWTEDSVRKAIADAGMTPEQWYERYGRVEGFAQGGVADGLSVIGNELVHFGVSSRVYPAETTFAMAEGGFEYAREAYQGMRNLTQALILLPAASDGSGGGNAALREEMAAMRQQNEALLVQLERIADNTQAAKNSLDDQLTLGIPLRK